MWYSEKRTRHSCSARSLGRLCNISRWSRSGATEISYERNTRLSFVQWMLKADILPEKISHVIGLSWQLLVYNSCATTLLLHAVYGVLSSQGLSTNHHVLHRLCFLLTPQTLGNAGCTLLASFLIFSFPLGPIHVGWDILPHRGPGSLYLVTAPESRIYERSSVP